MTCFPFICASFRRHATTVLQQFDACLVYTITNFFVKQNNFPSTTNNNQRSRKLRNNKSNECGVCGEADREREEGDDDDKKVYIAKSNWVVRLMYRNSLPFLTFCQERDRDEQFSEANFQSQNVNAWCNQKHRLEGSM